MQITVAALIVRFMERLGIARAYGMPGSHILPVYDQLYDSPIKTVLVKHEQGAAFMACGEARATGSIAACITTAGPGATNLVTGIANAYADKLPILIITGETSTSIFGKGGLQESSGEGGSIDQTDLFRGITRYHKIVERTDYLLQVLRQASRILLSPNAGPVLLSFPYNIQKELIEESLLDDIRFATDAPRICNSFAATEEMGRMIREARHPVIVAGHGCFIAGAQDMLQKLGERHAIRVATSLKGKGLIAENDPRAIGCLGVTSDGSAYRHIVDHADLMIVLGAGFNERTSYLWDPRLMANKRVIQVDHDATQLEKVFKADLVIHGDIRAVLEDLLICLSDFPAPAPPTLTAPEVKPRFTAIAHLFERLIERLPEAMVFDDNIILAQTYLKASPQHRYFPNSGVSSLGHAIPAAIGARCAIATPTFAVTGDGGFQMACMELMTAVNYKIPLNVVMINNGTLGLIRKNQYQLYQERYIDCDFQNPDYALLAQSFGIAHWRVETPADVDALFEHADLKDGINLIEVMWDKNVFPAYKSDR
ncbi:MAG: thiamine pyrophosphate-binding protein [Rhodocyclaceae bacterium]|nr:thiamine pyrophosphate-binding protein [Rhodocyclaceae bacterium]MDZ4216578.1 thiamine pyrophosphate-binding protein [Rhodocyclaceae bacterium]